MAPKKAHAALPDRDDLNRVLHEKRRVVLDDVVQATPGDAEDRRQ